MALITGVYGQDGSYAAELLAACGYKVVGTTHSRGGHPAANAMAVESWNLRDEQRLGEIVERHRPSEIFNFAAYSTGTGMYDDPVGICEVNGLAVLKILEAIRAVDPSIRFCQASSSEMFGEPVAKPQSELTPFNPRSPYGAAKLYAHNMIGIYRTRFDLFACSAILFNHESPRRTQNFVTRKVSRAAAAISLGLEQAVTLGNLDARRDWGFAGDAVRAMQLMLAADEPEDYVVATGRTQSVRDLCEVAFSHVGLDYRDHVRVNASDFRPAEPRQLVGDPSKAKRKLGWEPTIGFEALVQMMVDADLDRLRAANTTTGA
ncbi:GDP-mannose 4,6-dehydratase [Sphingomonas lutea]